MNSVKQYRKKPVVIEALHLTDSVDPAEAASWCGGHVTPNRFEGVGKPVYVVIPTLEGDMKATRGDYIIKGVKGEFYPCKPDVFEATYEPVEEEKRRYEHNS